MYTLWLAIEDCYNLRDQVGHPEQQFDRTVGLDISQRLAYHTYVDQLAMQIWGCQHSGMVQLWKQGVVEVPDGPAIL